MSDPLMQQPERFSQITEADAVNTGAETPPESLLRYEPKQIKRVLEAALLTAQEPLPMAALKKLFDNAVNARQISGMIDEIAGDWLDSGIALVQVASGWRFQARKEMQPFLNRLDPPKAPRYSRAVLETLAIIAYHQPVTRGDIEEIRGISVSSSVLKTLTSRGWVDQVGHRNVPGKPALLATTQQFLDDLGLQSLEALPPLQELGELVEADVERALSVDAEATDNPENQEGA
jgi:segregation and condensation protein B